MTTEEIKAFPLLDTKGDGTCPKCKQSGTFERSRRFADKDSVHIWKCEKDGIRFYGPKPR